MTETETVTPAIADPWAKPVVSIRLSSRRKAALLRIAAGMPAGASPSAAVDAAIAVALASPADLPEPLSERFEALEDAFGAVARDMRAVAERREAASLDAARASRAVLDLISAASSGGATDEDQDEAETTPLSAWLPRELRRLGARDAETAIVQATWRGMRKSGEGLAEIDLHAAVAAIDGKARSAAKPTPVSAGPVEIDGALFRAVAARAGRPLFVMLRRSAGAWSATIFASDAGGQAAERLGDLAA